MASKGMAYVCSERDHNLLHGSFTLGSNVAVWVAASGWPFFLAAFVWYGYWLSALSLVAVLAICSIPLEPRDSVKAWMCRGTRCYFREASLRYEHDIATDAPPTVLAVHPHGVFCMGWGTLFAQQELSHVYWCFANVLYQSPMFRAFTSLIGRPASASKASFLRLMRQRRAIAILPGGFEEATISSATVDRVYLAKRKGWVKYALQHGYSLTPVFTFGERETYANLQTLMPLRLWMSTFGLPGILPFGRWWCPILPRDRRLHIVVGSPLLPPPGVGEQPTDAQVDAQHKRYVAALTDLYDRHKVAYYGKEAANAELEIW